MLAPASELWLLRLSTRLSSTQPVCCFAGTENCSSRRRGVVPAVELQTVNYAARLCFADGIFGSRKRGLAPAVEHPIVRVMLSRARQ